MPNEDPFVGGTEGYSVVITGNMNPAIHHPIWYKDIGALTDAELAETGATRQTGMDSGSPKTNGSAAVAQIICTDVLSQFTSGKIRIICLSQSYTISTFDRTLLPRIREMASLVFQVLTHTPVTAYGLNFNVHRETTVGNVGALLAQVIDSTRLELMRDSKAERKAKFAYTFSEQGRALSVSIEQSRHAPNMVFVGINAHHPITLPQGIRQFDLTPLLQESMRKDSLDAEQILSKIMDVFKTDGVS